MKRKGFTLIESMIVIFIIGLLSVIATIGYGHASRQKKLEKAIQRVDNRIDYMRGAALFGEEVEDEYPCGYGVALEKGGSEVISISTDGISRLDILSQGESCDEGLSDEAVDLKENNLGDENVSSLGSIKIEKIEESNGSDVKCLSLIYSAPRGSSYYCISDGVSCPPASCFLDVFSVDLEPEYFKVTASLNEGGISGLKEFKILPSGNIEEILE